LRIISTSGNNKQLQTITLKKHSCCRYNNYVAKVKFKAYTSLLSHFFYLCNIITPVGATKLSVQIRAFSLNPMFQKSRIFYIFGERTCSFRKLNTVHLHETGRNKSLYILSFLSTTCDLIILPDGGSNMKKFSFN
jgi:hypothetical protein